MTSPAVAPNPDPAFSAWALVRQGLSHGCAPLPGMPEDRWEAVCIRIDWAEARREHLRRRKV